MADEKGNTVLSQLLASSDLDKLDSARPDLDRAFKVMNAKLPVYDDLWNYYDGDQPLMYTAGRLRDLFADLQLAKFVENWCSVVVDAANDKINLSSITSSDKEAATTLEEIWEAQNLALEAKDVHEAALVIGEGYLLIWPDEEDNPGMFYNDPRLVHLFYSPENPRKKWYGSKWWLDGDGHLRMNLYYPEKLEYYRSQKEANQLTSSKGLQPFNPGEGETLTNPYDEVPIFHFRPERRRIKGDMENAIPLQNGVNKLVTDMMVAAEYGAFKQRWIISNADTSSLENAPNMIWEIPAGDGQGQSSSVGEFSATELSNYIKAIDHLAQSMAIISRTPKHYLFAQGGTPSGEALIAMEAPLNQRVADHIAQFTPTWKEAAAFLLKIAGKEVDRREISVNYDKPEAVQPKTEAEIRNEAIKAGIPLKTVLRDEGKDNAWIEQMEKDQKEEQESNSRNLGAAVMAALRNANQPDQNDQNQNDPGNNNQ